MAKMPLISGKIQYFKDRFAFSRHTQKQHTLAGCDTKQVGKQRKHQKTPNLTFRKDERNGII